MTIESAGFIITGKDKDVIFATGETVDAAWADAVRDCGPFRDRFGDEISADEAFGRDFLALPATKALIDEVAAVGGALSWRIYKGVACTPAEDDAAI